MYSNGAICLIKLLFKMGLFTVYLSLLTTFCLLHDHSTHTHIQISYYTITSIKLVLIPLLHISFRKTRLHFFKHLFRQTTLFTIFARSSSITHLQPPSPMFMQGLSFKQQDLELWTSHIAYKSVIFSAGTIIEYIYIQPCPWSLPFLAILSLVSCYTVHLGCTKKDLLLAQLIISAKT